MKTEKYNVYEITPKICYGGTSLVAAKSVDEANEYINNFKKSDKYNHDNSWGYENIIESDVIENVWSEDCGIIRYGIYYCG